MAFLKRFGWYLIGFSVGLVFLTLFLKKKSEETGVEFCYLPNCRVLKALRENPLKVQDPYRTMADTTAIAHLLREGDVNFDQSEPRAEPCGIFNVSGCYNEQQLQLTLERCDSTTRLTEYAVVGPCD
jgi:hypothetical protein